MDKYLSFNPKFSVCATSQDKRTCLNINFLTHLEKARGLKIQVTNTEKEKYLAELNKYSGKRKQ